MFVLLNLFQTFIRASITAELSLQILQRSGLF